MTLRLPLAELAPGERELDAEASRYLGRVHRLEAGARFVAFDPAACAEAEVEVLAVGRRVRVRVGAPRAAARVAARRLRLVQALAKGAKIDAVVRDATELGATEIFVVASERSVKRGGDAARWRRIAVEAARQCGRGDAPAVLGPGTLAEALAGAAGLGLLLDPDAPASLGGALAGHDAGAPIYLLVGPEGGFSDAERSQALAAGCVPVRLGRFVLRTETACAAALGAIAALTP